MAYADEEYYTSMWMTGTIPAENLKGYLSKASMEIDNMTFGRLRKGLPEDPYYQDKIRSAVCETADLLYSYNVADNLAMQALKEMNSKDMYGKTRTRERRYSKTPCEICERAGQNIHQRLYLRKSAGMGEVRT